MFRGQFFNSAAQTKIKVILIDIALHVQLEVKKMTADKDGRCITLQGF